MHLGKTESAFALRLARVLSVYLYTVYHICRAGQNHIYIYIYSFVILAGKSPDIQSYTVWMFGP